MPMSVSPGRILVWNSANFALLYSLDGHQVLLPLGIAMFRGFPAQKYYSDLGCHQ